MLELLVFTFKTIKSVFNGVKVEPNISKKMRCVI